MGFVVVISGLYDKTAQIYLHIPLEGAMPLSSKSLILTIAKHTSVSMVTFVVYMLYDKLCPIS